MSEPSTTIIDLLRHGEPVGGKKYRGHLDDPLSERGWDEMRAAVDGQCLWDAVVTSPLTRCTVFAQELAKQHRLPLEVEPRFKEIGFGSWEGRTAAELLQADPGCVTRFWADPVAHRPPGAEPLTAFAERVLQAWNDVATKHQGRRVLIVCHAGVIRMLIRHVLDMPLNRLFRIHVPSASLTRLAIDHDGAGVLPRLVFHAGRL